MSYIVSIQGGMASGKTTAARLIEQCAPGVTVSYEYPPGLLDKPKIAHLSRFSLEDYLQIQKMYIHAEVKRFAALRRFSKVVLDQGPEEIEFYTLNFPSSFGMSWDIERLLAPELEELRACQLDGILFLDARSETLRRRKDSDKTHDRRSFDHYLMHLHRRKKEWFLKQRNATFLNTDAKSEQEVGQAAVKWLKGFEAEARRVVL